MGTLLKPSDIHFSQDSIRANFGQNTPHANRTIGQTLDDILTDKCRVADIPPISVTFWNNRWVTHDNRRLWVFKKAEMYGKLRAVRVNVVKRLNPRKLTGQGSQNIRIRSGEPGGNVWRNWNMENPNR